MARRRLDDFVYDGPYGYNNQVCNCSGVGSLVEKFDTWLQPNVGASAVTCFSCAIVNIPGGSLKGTATQGSNILHVTQVDEVIARQHPAVGTPITTNYSVSGSPPFIVPKISACPNDTCDGSPGDYTINVPGSTCATGCTWRWIFPASVDTADYENNVWVSNVVNATGASREAGSGPGKGGTTQIWWAGYGIYQTVIVKNNYVDLCGAGPTFNTAGYTTGAPDYHCVIPQSLDIKSAFGGANGETSVVEGGNVMMTKGAYFGVFKAQNSIDRRSSKSRPVRLLPAPMGPQGPGPRSRPRP